MSVNISGRSLSPLAYFKTEFAFYIDCVSGTLCAVLPIDTCHLISSLGIWQERVAFYKCYIRSSLYGVHTGMATYL